jgi:hypothetical protein
MGESAHGKSWEFDFFVSYTHEDVKQAEWIAWVLNQAGYRVIIQKWDFTVGRNWFAAMDNASRIAERTVAVLSKAYGDSDYCRLEWQQAMELDPGGTKRKLVPIRIVPYKPDSYLRQVVYIDLVGLAEDEARERIIAGAHQAVTGEAIPATAPSFVPSGPPPGAHRPPHPEVRLPDLPIPSERHVPRPGLLDDVRGRLVPGAGRGPAVVGLVGMGGVGKTTVARAVADDAAVRARFTDGVAWLTAGRDADPVACQRQLAAMLGDASAIADVAAGRDRLRALLAGTSRLIVADDVWDAAVTGALDVELPDVRLLVTTRDRQALGHGAAACLVDLVDDDTARRILAAWAGTTAEALPPQAQAVITLCGGLPLALAAVGGLASDQVSWESIAARVRDVDLKALRAGFPDYPAADLLAPFDASVAALPGPARDRYLRLAVFEHQGPVPARMAHLLWSGPGGDERADEELLALLARRSLLRLDPAQGTFNLHDLQFGYARWAMGGDGVAAAQRRLAHAILDGWGGVGLELPATASRSFGSDPADQYAVEHLAGYLAAAGEAELLDRLLAMEGSVFTSAGIKASGNLWFTVHDRLTDMDSYQRDVAAALALAEAATDDALARGEQAPGVATEIRYALMLASVASIAGNIPTWLLGLLVRDGLMPVTQALAYARSMPMPLDRFHALAELLPVLPAAAQGQVAEEALSAFVDNEGMFSWDGVLADVAPYLSPQRWAGFIAESLARARAVPDVIRAHGLLQLADVIPEEQRDTVLAEAEVAARAGGFGGSPYEEARALTKMAARLPAGQRGPVLARARAAAQRGGDGHLCSSRLAEIAELHTGLRRRRVRAEALAQARTESAPMWRSRALLDVAPLFSGGQHREILAEALASQQADREAGPGSTYGRLAEALPDDMLPGLLAVSRSINDPDARCRALLAITARLPLADCEQVMAEALAAARQVADQDGRPRRGLALSQVAHRLPAERRTDLLWEAFIACRRIGDEDRLIELRAAIGSRLPDPEGGQVLRQAVAAAQAAREPGDRMSRLKAVARWAPAGLKTELLTQALDIIASDVRKYYSELARLARDIPAELADRAFDIAAPLADDPDLFVFYGRALVDLADWVSGEFLGEVARAIVMDSFRWDGMPAAGRRALARMSASQLAEAIESAGELYNENGIAVLKALMAEYLPEPSRRRVQDEVLDFARTVGDPANRAKLLIPVARGLPADRRAAVLREALDVARRIESPDDRVRWLAEVAALMTGEDQASLFAEALSDAATATWIGGTAGPMATVAARAAGCGVADWPRYWRPVMRQAAAEGRPAVATQACRAFAEAGIPAGADVPAGMLAALDDVIRWWP